MAAPTTQPTFNYDADRPNSGLQQWELSKAFHTSTATVTAVTSRAIMLESEESEQNAGSDGRPRSSLLRAPG